MKVLFMTNTLNYRGTTTALLDYARHNQELLGNESIIGYDNDIPYEKDMGNELSVVIDTKTEFHTEHINAFNFYDALDQIKPDLIYKIGSGEPIIYDTSIKVAHHAVFQYKNYTISAYVSKWLSDHMTDGLTPYVPHMIDLPEPDRDYRDFLNIPKDAIVIGRHGGYDTFDINFVKDYVDKCNDKNVYFLMMNTRKFTNNKNVIYLNPIHDKYKLSDFINTCDGMLHARHRGESFGLSIAEFLYHNKPVLSWKGGHDKNHIDMLKDTHTLYENKSDIKMMISNIRDMKHDWKSLVSEYTPKNVMNKFNEVFIGNK